LRHPFAITENMLLNRRPDWALDRAIDA